MAKNPAHVVPQSVKRERRWEEGSMCNILKPFTFDAS